MGIASVLHNKCHKLKFELRLLRIAYHAPPEIGIQAGGWGFGENVQHDVGSSEAGSSLYNDQDLDNMDDNNINDENNEENETFEVAMALESVADSLLGVAQNLIDSVYLNDSWRFFRRTGGNGVEWTHQEALNRRMRLSNQFNSLVLPPWHVAGDWCTLLDLTKVDIDDDMLRLTARTNPKFTTLSLKGCVTVSSDAIKDAIASRGKGLLHLDLSNGVRSCGDVFKPKELQGPPPPTSSHQQFNNKKKSFLGNVGVGGVRKNETHHNGKESADSNEEALKDAQLAAALGSLLSLSLNRCPGLSSTLISFVALRCKSLLELDVSYNSDNAVDDVGLRWLAAASPQLQKLKIDRSVAVTDIGMRVLVTRCTRLSHLNASHCPKVLGNFFLVEPAHEKAPSRVVVKCRQLQFLDLSHCEDLDPFLLSWAGSSASRLRHVDVRGTPAASNGSSLFALCHCTHGMERLVIDSDKPIAHQRITTMDYGDDQEDGPCAAEAPRTFGNRSKPLSSKLLITALGELNFGRGLLELECDSLTDRDLAILLSQQGKIIRVLKLKKAIQLVGHAFAAYTDLEGINTMVAECTHKKRLVDRHGEELPNVHLDLIFGELQTLELANAHKLAPIAFKYLAQLKPPNLHTLAISGLRGGGRRHAPALSGFLREVGPQLVSLSLQDMIIDDTIGHAISDGCRPRIPFSSAVSLGAVSGGSGGGLGGLFGGLGGLSQPAKPKKTRQYTTVDDLPKLRSLVLEYVRDPKKAKSEQLKDVPRKGRKGGSHGDRSQIARSYVPPRSVLSGSAVSSQEYSDIELGSGVNIDFDEIRSTHSSLHEEGEGGGGGGRTFTDYAGSDGSFSEYGGKDSERSGSNSEISGLNKQNNGPRTGRARSVRSGSAVSSSTSSRNLGMTDVSLSAIVTSVGSCLTSFQLLGFEAITGNNVFDLAGAVGVEGTGKKHSGHRKRHGGRRKSHLKSNRNSIGGGGGGTFDAGSGYHTAGSQSPGGDSFYGGSGFSTRAGSVEATPLRANSLAVSRAVTRPGSAKKSVSLRLAISPSQELRSPKVDATMSPVKFFSGMPAGILKTSSNMVLPEMGDSRMEFANRRAQEEFMEKKQAEEQEMQAAGLRSFSVCHAPGFFQAPLIMKKKGNHGKDGGDDDGGHHKSRGRRKHRSRGGRSRGGRTGSSHGSSVSSDSSDHSSYSRSRRSRSGDHHAPSSPSKGDRTPKLTAGFISTHNSLMEKKSYKDGGGTAVVSSNKYGSPHKTRMKIAKQKRDKMNEHYDNDYQDSSGKSRDNQGPISSLLKNSDDDEQLPEDQMTEEQKAIAKAEKKAIAKQAQRRAGALKREANIKENERVRAAAPGWSLPALKELAIVGCTNFSVKGLKRLIANTPQLRRLDATDCRYLVPRAKEVDGFGSSAVVAPPPPSSSASVIGGSTGGGSVLGSTKSYGAGSQSSGGHSSRGRRRRHRKNKSKKKGKVDWEELSSKLPYCRAAPLSRGLAPTPDAEALAWRDSYIERFALEVRACRTVINCFRSFKFRRVYIVRHAAFVLTRFWKTFNIGMLKVLRLYRKVTLKRKLRRQFFLNLYCTLNAGRLLRRLARGSLARAKARILRAKMTAAAVKVQRMVRAYFDWLLYFKERARLELEDIEDNPRFGFGMPAMFHHKPPYSEAKLMKRVKQIPIFDYDKPPVKLACNGMVPFSEDMIASGTGFTGDMDVRRAFKAEPADIYSNGEVKPKKKQPLGMPERPRSFYS
mmetsp:Transcript_23156/g.30188  ORF Transcript_23156/g.30188 Transcript_23156/m.30188 type:complete len:1734 (+) Transcript_23156:56-5257(+)